MQLWLAAGMQTGFCGSLSTVSTWINEISVLNDLNTRYAYRYALISVLSAQLLCLFMGVPYVLVNGALK